ncbi:hypothetical protein KCV07_g3141, partial [Aureobasidium melanogenum]
MDRHSISYHDSFIFPCEAFVADECWNGYCWSEHHENLDPVLVGSKEPKDYMVPNKPGQACTNCLDNLRECDKNQHDITDERDPCSECRHFGSTKCKCTLSTNSSYNDVVYNKMLSRGHVHDYTLAPLKPRVEHPMPPHRVKAGWAGESKQQLLAKSDFLPIGARDCPRAFIVPPREPVQQPDHESSPVSDEILQMPKTFSCLPPSLPPPAFARPPRRLTAGEVEYTTFVWEMSQWRHVYENGDKQPSSLPPPSFPRPQPDSKVGKVMHTTFIWGTGQWRLVYENNTYATFPHLEHASFDGFRGADSFAGTLELLSDEEDVVNSFTIDNS